MRIVILDGNTINPGDINWRPLEAIGEVEYYPRTKASETLKRCKKADVIITSKVILDKNIIEQLPNLKYIGVIATGYNVVDLQYTREREIVVTNIPNYCTSSVAQLVIALMMSLARKVDHHDKMVKEGKWSRSTDFCFWDYPQIEMDNKVLGLVGCGNIGFAVAKIAKAMEMKIIAFDPYAKNLDGIELTGLDTVFKESDFLSLHCPLTDETKHIINTENIKKMKESSYLINTSRGPLVNIHDLSDALNNELIAGAALDVLEVEPPEVDNPIFKAKNSLITPHIAWASIEARMRLVQITADNINAFLDGKPINMVN